jgi:hypothetical protein
MNAPVGERNCWYGSPVGEAWYHRMRRGLRFNVGQLALQMAGQVEPLEGVFANRGFRLHFIAGRGRRRSVVDRLPVRAFMTNSQKSTHHLLLGRS